MNNETEKIIKQDDKEILLVELFSYETKKILLIK